jgi:hypothetical protein
MRRNIMSDTHTINEKSVQIPRGVFLTVDDIERLTKVHYENAEKKADDDETQAVARGCGILICGSGKSLA